MAASFTLVVVHIELFICCAEKLEKVFGLKPLVAAANN